MYAFFFSSRRRHTRWPRDWSSDVCSSDLDGVRRPVDLPVREHRHVPLHVCALALPKDDAVDVTQLRLEWMDDLVLRLELVLQPAAALDQARQLARLDALLERRVERPAECDVDPR